MPYDAIIFSGYPSRTIPWNADPAMLKAALLQIPLLTDLQVSFSVNTTLCNSYANVVTIQFTQQFGALPPLVAEVDTVMAGRGGTVIVSANGNPVLTDVHGKRFTSVTGTKEADPCANRGLCDHTTGVCHCFDSNGDAYDSSNGYGSPGIRGDCG